MSKDSLTSRLIKNSKIDTASLIEKSELFNDKDLITTEIPMLNVAFSGDIDGGFQTGINIFAGPSKHFKTMYSLICAKAFQDKYEDGVVLFYDSEFGSPPEYFKSAGIDMNRVVHVPIMDIEKLKFSLVSQLEQLDRKDKVIVIIDSLGNMASKKELEDAMNEKSVADMTRAKAVKSLFRMITPLMREKDIPAFVISHTYDTMDLFPKKVVSGGVGQYYAADSIFIIGRRQEKEKSELAGYNFVLRVEKSRFIKEGSEIPITVLFNSGVQKYSGMLDIALLGGYVVSPSKGWYQAINPKTGEVLFEEKKFRKSDLNDESFWSAMLQDTDLKDFISKSYKISVGSLVDTRSSSSSETTDSEENLVVSFNDGQTGE